MESLLEGKARDGVIPHIRIRGLVYEGVYVFLLQPGMGLQVVSDFFKERVCFEHPYISSSVLGRPLQNE